MDRGAAQAIGVSSDAAACAGPGVGGGPPKGPAPGAAPAQPLAQPSLRLCSRWLAVSPNEPVDPDSLHRDIAPDKWGVTRKDLRCLRKDVAAAIRQGTILPTTLDEFDPLDMVFGPTIYTVNEQYIKPVTAKAGGMSWALMRHPRGLTCDLFVTHCWQEGLFEFVDKVVRSWPQGAKSAWCCMLANPQNLDIGALIRSPSESPFAKALRQAKWMLVVPNRNASIYTRLWCVYEAFLACQWDKVILTASAPRSTTRRCPFSAATGALGLGLNFAVHGVAHLHKASLVFNFGSYPLVAASMLCTNIKWRRACTCVGALASGLYGGLFFHPDTLVDPHLSGYDAEWISAQRRLSVACLIYFVIAEMDIALHTTALEEAAELLRGYTGTVRDAACSKATDVSTISAEIEGCIDDVDRSVYVLVKAGMSTRGLRAAVDASVDVDGFSWSAGSRSFRWYALFISMPDVTALTTLSNAPVSDIVLVSINSALFIVWIVFLRCSPADAEIFSNLIVQKGILVLLWPISLAVQVMWTYNMIGMFDHAQALQATTLLFWLVVLTLSVVGLQRLAVTPVVGRPLAQLIVSRGRRTLSKAFEQQKPAPWGGPAAQLGQQNSNSAEWGWGDSPCAARDTSDSASDSDESPTGADSDAARLSP